MSLHRIVQPYVFAGISGHVEIDALRKRAEKVKEEEKEEGLEVDKELEVDKKR